MKIGELFVELGIKADFKTLRDFTKSLGDMSLEAAGTILGLAGVTFEIGQLISHSLDAAVGFNAFTAQTGLASDELQRWQYVAKGVGVSADAVQGSIMGISHAMAALNTGNGASLMAFGNLGINPQGKNDYRILAEMRAAYQRAKTPDEHGKFDLWSAQILGGNQMDAAFALPDKEFNARFAGAPVMKKGEVEAGVYLNKQLSAMGSVINNSLNPALLLLAGFVERLNTVLGPWLEKTAVPFIENLGVELVGTEKQKDALEKRSTAKDMLNLDKQYGITDKDSSDVAIGKVLDTMFPINLMNWAGRKWDSLEKLATSGAWMPSMMSTIPAPAPNLNLTNNIYSMADAEEVGRHAVEHTRRTIANTTKNVNNQGH